MSEITFIDLVKYVIKHIRPVIIAMVVFTLIGFVYANKQQSYSASVDIKYTYSGAEEGKDPKGGKLDVYEIMSPKIIEKTISDLNLDTSVDSIRNNISITPFIDEGTAEIKKAKLEKGEEFEYYPTVYTITYTYPAEFGPDHGKYVLGGILENYDEFMRSEYSGQQTLPYALQSVDYSSYDYMEVCDLLYNQISNAQVLLGRMDKENYTYRSAKTGLTFSDLYSYFTNLLNTDYNKLYANVRAGLLSKDKETLIKKYQYKIESLKVSAAKKDEEARIANQTLDDFYKQYKISQNIGAQGGSTVIKEPAIVPSGELGKDASEKVQSTYDEIMLRYVDSSVSASDARNDVRYYAELISLYQNDTVPAETKQHLAAASDELIEKIDSKLKTYVELTNETLSDYYRYKGGQFVTYLTSVAVNPTLPVGIYTLFSLCAGTVLGIILAMLIEIIKSLSAKAKEKEAELVSELVSAETNPLELTAMERYLYEAIYDNFREFKLYFQPIVDISGHWIGAEALIRWDSHKVGMVMPSELIPIAEKFGLMTALGDWVLRESCLQCKKWNESGYPDMNVTINFSSKQIESPLFLDSFFTIIRETKVNPKNITLEISNGGYIVDVDRIAQKLTAIKSLGVKISIDDFGTGYSSLNMLHQLPIDLLKIDKKFIREIRNNISVKQYITNLLMLAHILNIKVCAEGVETVEQFGDIKDLGVDYMQGYHFAKPISADQFEVLYQYSGAPRTFEK